MKKEILIICIMFFSFGTTYSQKTDTTSILDTRTYTISYFGNNLLKPGIKLETNVILTEKIVIKKKGVRTKQFLLGGNLGFYWHHRSHIGGFNYYQVIYKNTKTTKLKHTKIGIGPGIYRSFYPQTYSVSNGNVNKASLAGRTYFAPVLSFGTGRIIPDRFFQSRTFSTNLMFLFDYNSGIVPLLNFEVGLCFNFNSHYTLK